VLLTGPSGTGKEMFAHSIHNASDREEHPFVAINCAAIPREIAESELFGYAPGSFTGASREGKIGKLEAADQGTVFLDEIGDMPLELQAKLLRLLEQRCIARIGGRKDIPVNIRVIAATNRDLPELVDKGEFREDLYYRLNVSTITLPSLADCRDDIPELALSFINYFNETMGKKVQGMSPDVLERFKGYAWPGNIRELRNVVFGALVSKRTGDALLVSDLPRRLWAAAEEQGGDDANLEARLSSGSFNLRREVEKLERRALELALRRSQGNAAEAARLLGEVGRGTAKDPGGTVRTMMKRLKL
jgi:transcriptional regulator with PAS, ATPase and Fis domain